MCDGLQLATDAGYTLARQHADAVTGLKCRVGVDSLHHGDHLPAIEFHGQLDSRVPGDAFFRSRSRESPGDGADGCSDGAPRAMPYRARRDAAGDPAGDGTETTLRAFDLHFAYRFYRTHANGLLGARLIARIDVARLAADTTGKQRRSQQNNSDDNRSTDNAYHGAVP